MIEETIQEMQKYLKCVGKNRFTFAGYAVTGVCLGILAYYSLSPENRNPAISQVIESATGALQIFGVSGSFCLILTTFGLETLGSYNYTTKYLKEMKNPQVNDVLRRGFRASPYCNRKGIELAVEEAGLDPAELRKEARRYHLKKAISQE